MKNLQSLWRNVLGVLLFLSTAASLMLLLRFFVTGSTRFSFLLWNLFLAWLPALISLWFTRPRKEFHRVLAACLFIFWLFLLPNTFYILSDFVHLRASGDINILFDAVLLFSFSAIGFLLGLLSLGIMHLWIRRYIGERLALGAMYVIIYLCSFAIYLGRYLRWNSWDIFTNPLGLLVDVSDRVIAPLDHPRTLSTTVVFFALIGVSYGSFWWIGRFLLRNGKNLVK